MIQYKVSGIDADRGYPLHFNSSSHDMAGLKQLFIAEVNMHKDPEPADEDYDVLPEDVAIHLIRGTGDTVYQGKMDDWDDTEMRTFIASLKNGDRLFIELITQA